MPEVGLPLRFGGVPFKNPLSWPHRLMAGQRIFVPFIGVRIPVGSYVIMDNETEYHDWLSESPKEKLIRLYDELQKASSKEEIVFLYEEIQRIEN